MCLVLKVVKNEPVKAHKLKDSEIIEGQIMEASLIVMVVYCCML